ncbi:hypothetical protein AtNW77_Chr3g0194841 [Arabidopsis thaliana]|uniref:At3g42150 n=5 Tax=Arabidopsis TaxID=3701 RepID=Q9M2N7_ARATH|nr:uncharacterized protein AT3G42150 [Arabidopsis thaliana]NP_566862.1 uncharacterized protein AT3G42150 [Arabidopsis thaliana]NP_974377.1 uncharacterized protein AT3G42150 [Arabidopsis thaliana]KAG7627184.1 hypothetical protein ISN45_At03g034570 [Arabidopsis thaliana x Arabidopsis arenosa]KAG7633131.1 hypothetical protein ISN44_As03g033480 [Arabidopsis suecica]AAM63241.1 unknown [Arabidopsis thaliana]ABD38878.1 At3g42150 [Arabidopsis thaliana]AEE77723.1 transmembrane protein [Arabidopsis th|eukprot:NP_001030798.1 transmembrane protein [Arabidopsis thaliana]
MGSQKNVKHLEECTVSNALGTWVFSVLGALVAIPVGIKRKSLGPLVFFGTTGTMLDIIIGVSQCEREHAEHQTKLLQDSQNATTTTTTTNTETEDSSSMS